MISVLGEWISQLIDYLVILYLVIVVCDRDTEWNKGTSLRDVGTESEADNSIRSKAHNKHENDAYVGDGNVTELPGQKAMGSTVSCFRIILFLTRRRNPDLVGRDFIEDGFSSAPTTLRAKLKHGLIPSEHFLLLLPYKLPPGARPMKGVRSSDSPLT